MHVYTYLYARMSEYTHVPMYRMRARIASRIFCNKGGRREGVFSPVFSRQRALLSYAIILRYDLPDTVAHRLCFRYFSQGCVKLRNNSGSE